MKEFPKPQLVLQPETTEHKNAGPVSLSCSRIAWTKTWRAYEVTVTLLCAAREAHELLLKNEEGARAWGRWMDEGEPLSNAEILYTSSKPEWSLSRFQLWEQTEYTLQVEIAHVPSHAQEPPRINRDDAIRLELQPSWEEILLRAIPQADARGVYLYRVH
ncbi:MAG: hypothetical protein AAGJ35_10715, partial [Myxococcota bacterium]